MDAVAPLPRASGKTWQRSTRCAPGNCVEVARDLEGDGVLVRSSLDPVAVVRFTRSEWVAFLAGAQAGEFDLR